MSILSIFDVTIFKNFKKETLTEIVERKNEEDVERFAAIKRMELKDKFRSGAVNSNELPEYYKQIEEYRNQRFQYYLDSLNKQSTQR